MENDEISFMGLNLKSYIRLVFFALCLAAVIFVALPAFSSFSFAIAYVVLSTGLIGILSETVFKQYQIWNRIFVHNSIAAALVVIGFFYLLANIIQRA